ncbi:hypothetical protein EV200_105153 [Pedobacter psychrotolerans]|uniref:Cytochrome c domain-containing protein n=1 Tax=Pedobacter psychrotolerans TaxID=1843235 RepID=A0A4R2HBH3_9SPHI|nr:hypothetical protein [Pedobacter psychrotolerans]TCO23684.1 hypothetical protein EV200_105153 [Pedobacter psychrotolerans]GGE61812.1 hypothetical protein GCM10011413_30220 [Pedobacter psychrotolerans]
MVSNLIKLGLGSLSVLVVFSCQPSAEHKNSIVKRTTDSCRYYRYNVGQIISNLGCKNCHVSFNVDKIDVYGITTWRGLAAMDSLKLIDYAFTKKHKGWYSKNGDFKTARMDTLSDCEIRSVIRYIKDFGRDIPMPSQ